MYIFPPFPQTTNPIHLLIMGLEPHDPNSTPKLSLSKLPYSKTRDQPPRNMIKTPPLRSSVSIPFRWEEAPGKPRAAASPSPSPPPATNKSVARCLDLPPRLLHDETKFTIMPSPTTVLDGPYVGRSLSLACTFSFRKGPGSGREDGLRPVKRNFGSMRWGSFKEGGGKFGKGSFDIPHSLGDIFKSEDNVMKPKATRVKRKRSFFNSKYSWADIYASVKQVVPWRRRKRPVSCSNMNMG